MQDRYAGDLGDFLKFGLLRRLAASEGAGLPLRLGVVWYRTVDERTTLRPARPTEATLLLTLPSGKARQVTSSAEKHRGQVTITIPPCLSLVRW